MSLMTIFGVFRVGSALRPAAVLALVCALPLVLPVLGEAANLKNHIESVRRDAAVVYLGLIEQVKVSERQVDGRLTATARIRIHFVARSPSGQAAGTDTLEYPTWDDDHPPYAGDGQYRLDPGTWLVVFKEAWGDEGIRYLLRGTRAELVRDLTDRRLRLAGMSEDDLRLNEIDEEGRRVQLELYQRLVAHLEQVVAETRAATDMGEAGCLRARAAAVDYPAADSVIVARQSLSRSPVLASSSGSASGHRTWLPT